MIVPGDEAEAKGPITGVFGGSFNPPHLAHVLAVTVVLTRFKVERLLVVPTYQHPFAKALAPYDDRVRMCELAMGWLPKLEVSRIEEELGGESRTLRTLQALAKRHASAQLRFVMGADLIVESQKWFGFEQIVALAPPIVLGRVGITYEGSPAPVLPAVSSTEVRASLAARGTLAPREQNLLEELVPLPVLEYIEERGLYR